MRIRRRRSRLESALESMHRLDGRGRPTFECTLPTEIDSLVELDPGLPAALAEALRELGIRTMFRHQAQTLQAVRRNENVVLTAPTASGKTLAFLLPILERLFEQPGAKALLIYPTNALINDQERALGSILGRLPIRLRAAVLTGATSAEARRALRADPPQLLLTNPEMLHLSLLGQHGAWRALWPGVQFVVLDELHQYRGLFGAHMAMVCRRVRRVAAHYASSPRFIACSATIGNAREVAERITGHPCRVVTGTAGRQGARRLVVWEPAKLNRPGEHQRQDATGEAVRLFVLLVSAGLGTILFSLSRAGVEEMLLRCREALPPSLVNRITAYRSGYTPDQRFEIEQRLQRGDLLGVISTNALELGIDIGGLDASIIAGFPGSRSSFWQQAGRAGRSDRDSLVIYVPFERVVDRYYAAHPDRLLDQRHEDAIVDLDNPSVLASQLLCAAEELPLRAAEPSEFSVAAETVVDELIASRVFIRSGARLQSTTGSTHAQVGLRGAHGTPYALLAAGTQIGSIDAAVVGREAFLGAVYVHAGRRYRVAEVSEPARRIALVSEPRPLATKPVLQQVVEISGPAKASSGSGRKESPESIRFGSGPLLVHERTVAYREVHRHAGRPATLIPLVEAAGRTRATHGWWLLLPEQLRQSLDVPEAGRFLAGLHALEHVLPAAVSLGLLCDPRDVLATFEPYHATLGGPAVFVFDDREGGAGIAVRAAARAAEIVGAACEIVLGCTCEAGCPGCIVNSACWRQQEVASKPAAVALASALQRLLQQCSQHQPRAPGVPQVQPSRSAGGAKLSRP